MMRVARWILAIYALLCAAALALIPISLNGWFGMEGDGLAAVYAILLAMPWSMMLGTLQVSSPWIAGVMLVVCMVANGAIIFGIGRLLSAIRKG